MSLFCLLISMLINIVFYVSTAVLCNTTYLNVSFFTNFIKQLCYFFYNTFIESSPSCPQTVVFHLSTQDFAASLNFKRSSKMHGGARRIHCSMCAFFLLRDRIHMLCLHRSIVISSAAPCCMCNLYVVC